MIGQKIHVPLSIVPTEDVLHAIEKGIFNIENIKCNKGACAAWSSLVSLRDSNTARDVYFVYVEVPYSKKWLDKVSKDKNKRKSVMQFFRVGHIDKCKEVVILKNLVPEYNKYTDPRSLLIDQLYRGRFYYSENEEGYIGNQDAFDNMSSYAIQTKNCGLRVICINYT
ncbi:hypothetical protein [Zymobacter sp. IVIA_12111.31 C1]|uniref:hypothetical protein n=1 Tax=Zymobacter sp. IVIA_12111.31 C1 TaxID=3394854 RepID=UPI0039C26000